MPTLHTILSAPLVGRLVRVNGVEGIVRGLGLHAWDFMEVWFADGQVYVVFYVLCDGRIFQAVLPHGDIGYTAFGLLGNVPGGVDTTMAQGIETDIQSWGMHIVITLYKNAYTSAEHPVVTIEYPSPSHELDSWSYPAKMAFY